MRINKNNEVKNGNHKPKIALFHYSGPPKTSGVDNIIRDQARLFRRYGYRVEIIVGLGKQFRKDIPVKVIRKISPKHPKVLSIMKELENLQVSKAFNKLEQSLFCSIQKYLIKNEINVCIFHNLFTRPYNLALTSALARLVKEMPEIKFITWVHDVIFYDEPEASLKSEMGKNYPWDLLVKPIPGLKYVCVSNFLRNNLRSALKEAKKKQIIVIHNGQDIEKFLGLSPAMRILYRDIYKTKTDLIACIPVRAIPRKNLQMAIKIAKSMVNKGVNFKLLLTANIDYKREKNLKYYEYLKNLVKRLGLYNKVFFLEEYFSQFAADKKPAPPIPIPELFLISDFLLFTSKVEGFGLPLIEAGLMKCPIFAADIPPLKEIGSTNIHYFKITDTADQTADYILENIKNMSQLYFYRKIINKFCLHTIFKKQIIPLVDRNNKINKT
jgi:glycosyltransferase involved in cell wall biosynthesis